MNLPFESALRHKSSREAADAGLLLWRENFVSFLPFFALPFWVFAFALRLLPGRAQYLSWLAVWLLKPLFDRSILHIISVRFFESGAGMKRLCRGLGKSLLRGLAGDLLWRRFSPLRSAMMPVRVLEASAGTAARATVKRREILKKGGLGYCSFLTLWGIALEITLLAGELLFFVMMAEIIRKGFISSFWGGSLKDAEIYIFALWCSNLMLVETLYVCMGFSLYINSRIEVEGWDIEITFRNFAKKIKTKSMGGLLVVFCLICLLLPIKGFADEPSVGTVAGQAAWQAAIPLEKLQNILDSPDFGGEKDSWGIRLKNPWQQGNSPGIKFGPEPEILRRIFAITLKFILIALIAGGIVFLLFYMRKFIRTAAGTAGSVIKILPEREAESPEETLKKAAVFFERGDLRLAWGYCTAAAIVSCQLYRGFVFPPNATESDCANIAGEITPNGTFCTVDEAQGFSELVKNWVNLAYAGRLPPEGSFEKAAAFCKSLEPANG
ncbi:MAG: hypothetical protein LBG91_05110 [Treponema sp.]|nr:hypothetical protein [Treponema sp.]